MLGASIVDAASSIQDAPLTNTWLLSISLHLTCLALWI
jgi:hypothetical protein